MSNATRQKPAGGGTPGCFFQPGYLKPAIFTDSLQIGGCPASLICHIVLVKAQQVQVVYKIHD